MKKKAALVLMTVVAMAIGGAAAADNLPEGNMGSGTLPNVDSPESGGDFDSFGTSGFESGSDTEASTANMPEAQVGSGTTPDN